MSYKLVCEDFRTDSFSNGDREEWNRKIDYVDQLVKDYDLEENGVKDLFYSLLQQGVCHSAINERISVVYNVLIAEGYKVNESV